MLWDRHGSASTALAAGWAACPLERGRRRGLAHPDPLATCRLTCRRTQVAGLSVREERSLSPKCGQHHQVLVPICGHRHHLLQKSEQRQHRLCLPGRYLCSATPPLRSMRCLQSSLHARRRIRSHSIATHRLRLCRAAATNRVNLAAQPIAQPNQPCCQIMRIQNSWKLCAAL